ncbi:MAG: hypothetical protein Fur0010_16780 [Bdellovibrio sp.]
MTGNPLESDIMGLLFQFPNQHNDLDDRISIDGEQRSVLKTYGLPWIFWGYYAAVLVVLFFMYLAIRNPIEAILNSGDSINIALAYLAIAVMLSIALFGLGMLFYEKVLIKKDKLLTITHKVFWLPIWKTTYLLTSKEAIELAHFMDSPNMARIKHEKGLEAFENRGYFEAIIICEKRGKVAIDRHSQKHDIKKFIELLKSY